jgi:hypothetical protein
MKDSQMPLEMASNRVLWYKLREIYDKEEEERQERARLMERYAVREEKGEVKKATK